PYPPGLFVDAFLFQLAQELHPFHGQNRNERAVAEYGEDVQFQGAEGSAGRAGCPPLAAGGVPFTGQVLESVAGSFAIRFLLRASRGAQVGVWVGFGMQLGRLPARLRTGKLVLARAVATQSQP